MTGSQVDAGLEFRREMGLISEGASRVDALPVWTVNSKKGRWPVTEHP